MNNWLVWCLFSEACSLGWWGTVLYYNGILQKDRNVSKQQGGVLVLRVDICAWTCHSSHCPLALCINLNRAWASCYVCKAETISMKSLQDVYVLIEMTTLWVHTHTYAHTHYYADPPTLTINVIQQRKEAERGCVDLMCRTILSTLPLIPRHTHKSAAKWSKKGPLHLDLWAFNQPICHINFHLLNLHPFTGDLIVCESIWFYMEGQKVSQSRELFISHIILKICERFTGAYLQTGI